MLAVMVGGLFTKKPKNPLDLIPPQYRPPKKEMRQLTGEEREAALEQGVSILDEAFKRE